MRAYEQDYAGWVEDTARAIEEGRFSEIDRVALADEVRDLANAGRLEEARMVCHRGLLGRPTAELYSLLGVIHLAAGRQDDAGEAFRKALYLDPEHREALTHTMVLSEHLGDLALADGLRRRLARLDREVGS